MKNKAILALILLAVFAVGCAKTEKASELAKTPASAEQTQIKPTAPAAGVTTEDIDTIIYEDVNDSGISDAELQDSDFDLGLE